jgi:hypothetical protein
MAGVKARCPLMPEMNPKAEDKKKKSREKCACGGLKEPTYPRE